jgi:2-haloacid dehalogenase
MPEPEIDAIVFDVLGTLVDEPTGIRAAIRQLAPSLDDPGVEQLLSLWQQHIDREQRRILDGVRPYLTSDVLDLEAARLVAHAAGVDDPTAVATLALAGRRLPPWPDTVAGLARLAERFPLIGLSNASRTALLELNAHAGLRWHQALSAEDARTYKPDPAVYQLAVTVSGRAPERLLMVAAHAWDLRGA